MYADELLRATTSDSCMGVVVAEQATLRVAGQLRILVVDDELPIVDLVAGYLVREGWEVRTAGDGVAALDAIRCWAPDLVVLDLMLPGIDGVEICKRMRAYSEAYVLMLTARSEEIDRIIGLTVGADDYMTKPFNDNELRARVRVAERLVRTQSSLSESVVELKAALNQVEMLENGIEACRECQKIFSPFDGEWHGVRDILENGADPRFIVNTCPACEKK